MYLIFTCILFVLLVYVFVRTSKVEHVQPVIYLILWFFSSLSLFVNSELIKLFNRLFPIEDFGRVGESFSAFFFVFACVTAIHQFFIYYYLHNMEAEPEKWKLLYPGFYGSSWDKTIRILAFFILLMAVDKVPFIKGYIYSQCSRNSCSADQNVIVLGGAILFFLLFVYDCIAGFWCKKWNTLEQWTYTISDFIAFLFWGIITWKIIVNNEQTMGQIAILPLLVGLAYAAFFSFRVGKSIYLRKIQ